MLSQAAKEVEELKRFNESLSKLLSDQDKKCHQLEILLEMCILEPIGVGLKAQIKRTLEE